MRGVRRSGVRVSTSSSTGCARRAARVAPCWRGHACGASGSPTTSAPTRPCGCSPSKVLSGVPRVVLAARMGCILNAVVADVVVPTPDYIRFATHLRFRADFSHAKDRQSKGVVENLVGCAKDDLTVLLGAPAVSSRPGRANTAAADW